MNEIVLLNISGQDRPCITSTLTDILARYDIPVLDIGQSVIHDALALGMLVEMPQDSASFPGYLPASPSACRSLKVRLSIAGLGIAFQGTSP